MIDAKATVSRDGRGQRGDDIFAQVLDSSTGGADQMVVVPWFAPDVGRHVAGPLQPLRQPGGHQAVEGTEDGGAADIGVASPDPLVEFLGGRLLARLRQDGGDRQPLRGQPDARLLQGELGGRLNHSQMILPKFHQI
jgi:hypothetical protein